MQREGRALAECSPNTFHTRYSSSKGPDNGKQHGLESQFKDDRAFGTVSACETSTLNLPNQRSQGKSTLPFYL